MKIKLILSTLIVFLGLSVTNKIESATENQMVTKAIDRINKIQHFAGLKEEAAEIKRYKGHGAVEEACRDIINASTLALQELERAKTPWLWDAQDPRVYQAIGKMATDIGQLKDKVGSATRLGIVVYPSRKKKKDTYQEALNLIGYLIRELTTMSKQEVPPSFKSYVASDKSTFDEKFKAYMKKHDLYKVQSGELHR